MKRKKKKRNKRRKSNQIFVIKKKENERTKCTYVSYKIKLYKTYYTVSYMLSSIVCAPLGACVHAHVCDLLGGLVAHPSFYKTPLSLQEIRSRLWNPANSHYGIPVPAHPTCLPRRLPHTSYLHCVILSAFTQTEDRSHCRLTAASLIWVNMTEAEESQNKTSCTTAKWITKKLYNGTTKRL